MQHFNDLAVKTICCKPIKNYSCKTSNTLDGSFSKIDTYINNTREPFTITSRNDLVTVFPETKFVTDIGNSILRNQPESFTIRREYNFCRQTATEVYLRLKTRVETNNEVLDEELSYIYEQSKFFYDNTNHNKNNHIKKLTIVVDLLIPVNELKNNVVLYVSDIDVVIKHGIDKHDALHPYSSKALSYNFITKSDTDRRFTGFLIEIIDSESNISDRFIKYPHGVVRLPTYRSMDRPSGVYYTEVSTDIFGKKSSETIFYTFSEAEAKFNIYKTIEEAEDYENIENKRLKREEQEYNAKLNRTKQDIELLRLEIKTKDHELENAKQRFIIDNLPKEKELESLKLETEKLKIENKNQEEAIKRHANERSDIVSKMEYEKNLRLKEKDEEILRLKNEHALREEYRSDKIASAKYGNELIKTIGTIVAGIFGLFVLFNKYITPSKFLGFI